MPLAGLQGKAGALDGLVPADRTAGGSGEALPLGEGEAAFAAAGGDQMETPARPGSPGQVLQMLINLFFRHRQALGEFQGGVRLFLEQLFDGLANSDHVAKGYPFTAVIPGNDAGAPDSIMKIHHEKIVSG